MSNPPRAAGNHGGDGEKSELEKAMAKTAAVVVFSGIAISVLKTLNPFKDSNKPKMEPFVESTQSEKTLARPPPPWCRSSQQPPLREPLFQIPVSSSASMEEKVVEVECRGKAVEIVKGDTLWGLSTRYGVSVQAIKEANGLKSDTIYAGKKLLIPNILLHNSEMLQIWVFLIHSPTTVIMYEVYTN